jgi:hypothetical protein
VGLGHWFYTLWFGYGWPSDRGNGPEALQQTIVYAAIAAIFVPIVRHFFLRELKKAHDEVHEHLHHIADELGLKRFERKQH